MLIRAARRKTGTGMECTPKTLGALTGGILLQVHMILVGERHPQARLIIRSPAGDRNSTPEAITIGCTWVGGSGGRRLEWLGQKQTMASTWCIIAMANYPMACSAIHPYGATHLYGLTVDRVSQGMAQTTIIAVAVGTSWKLQGRAK